MHYGPSPFDLQECLVILKVLPVLNAAEIAVVIVAQYGGNFCGSKIRSVQVPISLVTIHYSGQRSMEILTL